ERPAITNDEICAFFHEPAEFGDAFLGLKIKGYTRVNTALAEVAKHSPLIVKFFCDQIRELAQIVPEFLRRHSSVLPGRPRILLAGDTAGADARFARVPNRILIFFLFKDRSFAISR